MPGLTYSIIGIIAIMVHCTINKESLVIKGLSKKDRLDRTHSLFLWGVLLYFITDALWGVLDEYGSIELIYADTFIYYIAMSLAVVLWSEYVVFYLNQKNLFDNVLRYGGRLYLAFVLIALVINCFYPFFYYFDADGVYHAEVVRYISLYIQMAMFFLSGIQTFWAARRSEGTVKRRYITISLLGLAMTLAIVGQIKYPLLPIYSLGYLIGCCILYVYIEEDQKQEQILELHNRMNIISSLVNIFFCTYYIDMETREFVELDSKIVEVGAIIGQSGNADKKLSEMCDSLVLPQYKKELQVFSNLDTLDERLSANKHYISMQFEGVYTGWVEGVFVSGDRDENGKLKHAIWAIRTIRDEKEKETKLLYNSYIDELTGLYNRKMYEENISENIDLLKNENLVYISMDVNGLKAINDDLGHAAGDELIRAAAECMKKYIKPYGRVYRTGGDEFIAIINATEEQVEQLKENFATATANWEGKHIHGLSVSCGFVLRKHNPGLSLKKIENLADKNMYAAKSEHYRKNGVDRRGQQDAYKALCSMYTKILKVNLTQNEYSIVSMDEAEKSDEKGFKPGIFDWLYEFGKSGQVHEEDLENYFEKTSREYLSNCFKKDKRPLNIIYRRKIGEEFKLVEMQIVPAEDYKDHNQSVYLYVKNIDR